jgi:hypothetical protein
MIQYFTSMVTLSRISSGDGTTHDSSLTHSSNTSGSSGELNQVGMNTALSELAFYCAYNFPGMLKQNDVPCIITPPYSIDCMQLWC